MSYQAALEAAGATVREYREFGSYQGDWIAVLDDGTLISGSYGSCSGCDAFEAEFGWGADKQPDYQQRLAEFGRAYLDDPRSLDDLLKYHRKHAEWDSGSREVVTWLESLQK